MANSWEELYGYPAHPGYPALERKEKHQPPWHGICQPPGRRAEVLDEMLADITVVQGGIGYRMHDSTTGRIVGTTLLNWGDTEEGIFNMTNASFLRRQAEVYLKKAERVEALDALRELALNSIIVFARPRKLGSCAYVAIVLDVDNLVAGPNRRWFVTQSGSSRIGPFTDDQFINWLIDGEVEEIDVVTSLTPLAELNKIKVTGTDAD